MSPEIINRELPRLIVLLIREKFFATDPQEHDPQVVEKQDNLAERLAGEDPNENLMLLRENNSDDEFEWVVKHGYSVYADDFQHHKEIIETTHYLRKRGNNI